MYIATLKAQRTGGTRWVEISNIFDADGNPVLIKIHVSRTNGDRSNVAIDAPKNVFLRQKDEANGKHDSNLGIGNA